MKKLLLLAAVGMTVMAQAASYNWISGAIKTPADKTGGWSSTAVTSGSVSAYLFVIDQDMYNSLYSSTVKTLSDNVYNAYASKLATATASKSTGATISLNDGKTDWGAGSEQYVALLYILTDGDDKYYIGNVGYSSMSAAQNKTIQNLATNIGGGTGTSMTGVGWQAAAVPEPTSGLMLLLGVSLMALKRKRA